MWRLGADDFPELPFPRNPHADDYPLVGCASVTHINLDKPCRQAIGPPHLDGFGALLLMRQVPTVPAPVVAPSPTCGGSRHARLSRLLVGCDVEPIDNDQARRAGELVGKAARTDIVDGTVVAGALHRHDVVISATPKISARSLGPLIAGLKSKPLDDQHDAALRASDHGHARGAARATHS